VQSSLRIDGPVRCSCPKVADSKAVAPRPKKLSMVHRSAVHPPKACACVWLNRSCVSNLAEGDVNEFDWEEGFGGYFQEAFSVDRLFLA
jgi:hypothetical protein